MKNSANFNIIKIILIFVCLLIGSCADNNKYRINGKIMGTTWEVQTIGSAIDKTPIENKLKALNNIFSTWSNVSELTRLNNAPIQQWISVSEELFFVLTEAQKIYQQTDGLFDVGIGRLINTWGFNTKTITSVPNHKQIQDALRKSSIKYISFKDRQIKKHKDILLNLSAIAKGFAVDELVKILEKAHIKEFLIEIGGEVFARGNSWKVAVEMPNNITPIKIKLNNKGVASSGDYRNYLIFNGQKYQHIINPKTGYPAKTNLTAVSVVNDKTYYADALATTMLTMSETKARAFAKKLNLSVVLILNNFKVVKINL